MSVINHCTCTETCPIHGDTPSPKQVDHSKELYFICQAIVQFKIAGEIGGEPRDPALEAMFKLAIHHINEFEKAKSEG